MRNLILLLALPALLACAPTRQTCLRAATQDVAVVDRLILETQQNLARGYALDREAYVTNSVDLCLGSNRVGFGTGVGVGWSYCNTPTTRYRERPVAIDRAAEQRKLRELQQTRARLIKESEAALEQCNLRYPAG